MHVWFGRALLLFGIVMCGMSLDPWGYPRPAYFGVAGPVMLVYVVVIVWWAVKGKATRASATKDARPAEGDIIPLQEIK